MNGIKKYPIEKQGLILIKSITVASSSGSTEVTDAFSSRYRNYKIMMSGGSATTSGGIELQLGSETTGYYAGYTVVTYSTAAVTGAADNNASSWSLAGSAATNSLSMDIDLIAPYLSEVTWVFGQGRTNNLTGRTFTGLLNTTTSYTSFTLTYPEEASDAVIDVYGYTTA